MIKLLNKKKTKIYIPFILGKANTERKKIIVKKTSNNLEDISIKLKPNIQNLNKTNITNKSFSKEKKEETKIENKTKNINILDSIKKKINKNYNSAKPEKFFQSKTNNLFTKNKKLKNKPNNRSLEKSIEENYYTKRKIKFKSRANNKFLNSTNNSSITKNTILINKKNITTEISLSHNKTLLSDNISIKKNKNHKIINVKDILLNHKDKFSIKKNYFDSRDLKNKINLYSSKNNNKMFFDFKQYYYKKLKNSNDLIKEVNYINSLSLTNNNKNINSKKKEDNKITKLKNNNTNCHQSNNSDIINCKLSYTSRKQCKLKNIYNINLFNKNRNSVNDNKDISPYKIDDDENAYNDLSKITILIKSNWGNKKIIFISINLIDKSNKKIVINKANYDTTKPYIQKYNKGETQKLMFYYNIKNKIKNIEIINGFDDSGIKSIIIENNENEIIWRGIIPKKNIISSKPYIIVLNNIKQYLKNKKEVKRNNNFDRDSPLLNDKNVFSPPSYNNNKSFINSIYKKNNHINILISSKKNNNTINNDEEINEKKRKYYNRKETYDRDSDNNINLNFDSFINKSITMNQRRPKLENVDYQICDKIKIKLLSNYGNSKYIGLSGIEFYNEIDYLIDINLYINFIKTNQKVMNNKQKKLLYNLFNGKNDSIDPQYMFLTKNDEAFIEIDFKKKIKIKKIIIYNYNSNLFKNCGTKKISLIFFKNNKPEKTIKAIYLNKNIGEEGIEYKQILKYPFNDSYGIKKYKKLNNEIKYHLLNCVIIYNKEYNYYCPSYPSGFIIKLLILNNYGNNEYIGLESIKLYDENNNEIIMYLEDENNKENNFPNIYLLPENLIISPKMNPIIITKYKNEEKRLYLIFNNLIMLSKICIINYYKYEQIAVKDIKIFIDDNLIFEGKLNTKLNEIFFSSIEQNEINIKKKEINLDINNNNNIQEKVLENGTKVLSLI